MEAIRRLEHYLQVRAGEALSFWRREERVFESAGHWYFRTREGIDVGPYRTKFEAEIEAELLKHKLQEQQEADGSQTIRNFMRESLQQGIFSDSRTEQSDLRAHWHADIGVLN